MNLKIPHKDLKFVRSYFRKAGHVRGIDEKGNILVDLGQLEDETFLNSMQI